MKNHIIKLFNLEGFIIKEIEFLKKDKEMVIHIRNSLKKKVICPHCENQKRKRVRIHQFRKRKVKHGYYQNKKVFLLIHYRRFLCKDCRKTFREELVGIDKKRHSQRFRNSLLEDLRHSSFSGAFKKTEISIPTLIRFLQEFSPGEKIMWPRKGEIFLGIDAHSYAGKDLVITVTELKRHRLLKVLPDDRQKTLVDFLNNMPASAKQRVKAVCIDLDSGFRGAILKTLPQAKIVADKFHVLQEAERAMEDIRLIIQGVRDKNFGRIPKRLLLKPAYKLTSFEKKKLESIWEKYSSFPNLKEAWIIKEKIRNIYACSNYKIASYKLRTLISMLEAEKRNRRLIVLKGTLKRWKPYILNYFEIPITNGYTEGVNNKIKMIKRMSFGFRNIDNYISKITLAFLPLFWLLNYHQLC